MSCPSIGSDGLSSLNGLLNLTVLDLSYTFLMNLEPIFKSCIQLKVIKALWLVWCWMFSLSVSSRAYIIFCQWERLELFCVHSLYIIHSCLFLSYPITFGLSLTLYCLGTQITSLQISHWLVTGTFIQRRCFTGTWRVGPVLWNSLSDCNRWSTCMLHTFDPFELERLCKLAWPRLGFNQCTAIWLLWGLYL